MMGVAQTQKVEGDLYVLLPNNPFVPPQGHVCFINNLPPELLSRIFEIGATDNDSEDEDNFGDYKDSLCNSLSGEEDADDEESHEEHEDIDAEEGDEEETDSDDSDDSDTAVFQVVVSHVCRHWRNVALSTPSLWTTIIITPSARPPYEPVSTLLERSKGLPIDIFVDCEPECEIGPTHCFPSDEDLRFLYKLLTPHVHRWRTIEVAVFKYCHMFIFLTAVSHPSISAAPQLKRLQLYHHEETEESDDFGYPSMSKHLVLFGGSAPSLKSVVLWGVHVDWDQPWIASASKLIDFELAYLAEDVRPTWTQFATMLRGASSLARLSLAMSGPTGDPPGWFTEPTPNSPVDLNAPIQLPKVTDLVLAFHSQERAIGLVHRFVLPGLKNLVLDFDDGDYTDLVHVLAGPTTAHSLPSDQEQPHSLLSGIENLKLAGLPCRTGCAGVLYAKLQNLTSLNISLSHLSSEFLNLLCVPCTRIGQSTTWLPRLATLCVSGTSGYLLRNVVEKRKSAGVPLESLYVEESCTLDAKDSEWFKENLKTFEVFEGSDDEDDVMFGDLDEDVDEW